MKKRENNSSQKSTVYYCTNCGARLYFRDNSEFVKCPNCGVGYSKTDLMDETVQEQMNRLGNFTIPKEKVEEERELNKDFIFSGYGILGVLFLIFSVLAMCSSIKAREVNYIISGSFGLVLNIIYMAWGLFSRDFEKHSVIMLVAAVLVTFGGVISNETAATMKVEKIEAPNIHWEQTYLGSQVPHPDDRPGKVGVDTMTCLTVTIDNATKEEYTDLLEQYKDTGYLIEAESGDDGYSAYNDEGFYAVLAYYKYSNTMTIVVKRPEKMEPLIWPMGKLPDMLPVPNCKLGSIKIADENQFLIYIGDMSKEQMEQYIEKAEQAGFIRDETSYTYEAYKDGIYRLQIRYDGNHVVCINLEVTGK